MADISKDRDFSWRWQMGGAEALDERQLEDAEAAFHSWLTKYNRFNLAGFPVNDVADFVKAVQKMPKRTCGLETAAPTVIIPDDALPERIALANASLSRVKLALDAFMAAYKLYDAHFESIKRSPSLCVPMEKSPHAIDLDRVSWQLCQTGASEGERLRRNGTKMTGLPVKHPFLLSRALSHVQTVFIPEIAPKGEIPACPYDGDPDQLGETEKAILREWVDRFAEANDKKRRSVEGSSFGQAARADMMRWLEARGRLDDVMLTAEENGGSVSVSGFALTEQHRVDLRKLREEMSALHSARMDAEAQRAVYKLAEEGDDLMSTARELRVLTRIEEMCQHHKAHAKFHWVKSFHFEPRAQTEAAILAPRLIAAVRSEIALEVSGQAGRVEAALSKSSPAERAALATMARSSKSLGEKKLPTGKRPAAERKSLVSSIVTTGKVVGATMLAEIMSVLPSLSRQASRLMELARPTPVETAARKLTDWRLDGFVVADRRLRRAQDAATIAVAKDMRLGYARTVASDIAFMAKIRCVSEESADFIELIAGPVDSTGRKVDENQAKEPATEEAFVSR